MFNHLFCEDLLSITVKIVLNILVDKTVLVHMYHPSQIIRMETQACFFQVDLFFIYHNKLWYGRMNKKFRRLHSFLLHSIVEKEY